MGLVHWSEMLHQYCVNHAWKHLGSRITKLTSGLYSIIYNLNYFIMQHQLKFNWNRDELSLVSSTLGNYFEKAIFVRNIGLINHLFIYLFVCKMKIQIDGSIDVIFLNLWGFFKSTILLKCFKKSAIHKLINIFLYTSIYTYIHNYSYAYVCLCINAFINLWEYM